MSSASQTAPQRLGANVLALTASQAVTWSMSLVWTLIVPRFLGAAGLGVLVTASSATAVISVILGLGAKDFLVREIAADRRRGLSLAGTTVTLRACLVPMYIGAVVLYAHAAHFGPETREVLYLLAGATICSMVAEPVQATFQGIERMEYLAYGDIFNKTAQSALGIALAVAGFGAVGLSVSSLAVAVVGVYLWSRWLRGHARLELRTTVARLNMLVTQSLPYWAFGLFFMIYLWIDAVILALMAPPEVVGWYGAPTKLFTTLMFVPGIVATAWLPRMVGAFAEGRNRFRAVARTPVELVVIVSLPVCVIAATTARDVIPMLFGRSYGPAVPVMEVLAFCLPPMYVGIMLYEVLVATKRPLVWTWLMAGATVVNPALNIVLIRAAQHRWHNGAIGAALALLVTEILILVAGLVIAGRWALDGSSVRRFARALLVTAAMFGIMRLLRPFGFVAAAGSGAATFAGLAWLLRLASADELALLKAMFVRLRPGRHPEDPEAGFSP